MLVRFELKNKEIQYNNSMKDKQTIAQFLKVKTFPFIIKDDQSNEIYFERSNGFWSKYEYDDQGNEIYYEDSNGYWIFRNNTSSYLSTTITYTTAGTTAPTNPVVIPPANSTTIMVTYPSGTTSNYVLF